MSSASRLMLALTAAAGLAAAPAAHASLVWTHQYEGDVLPQNHPTASWTAAGTGRTESSDGQVLTVNTGGNVFSSGYYLQSGAWNGDTTTGSTVEIRFAVESGQSRFQIGKTGSVYDLLISPTRVAAAQTASDNDAAGGTGVDLDMTQFQTIRLVMSPGEAGDARTVEVYLNGGTTPVFSLFRSTSTANRLLFPDGGTSGWSGISKWDYVYWTNSEATAPIPEPAGLALLGAGVAIALGRRPRDRD